jgi:stage V sporulation protein SpoVS
MRRSACTVMAIPASVMNRALAIGARRSNLPPSGTYLISLPAWTIKMPIRVRTLARPRLKTTMSRRPKPIRCKAIAPNMTTSAEGQGSNPPETPSASKLRQVTGLPSAPGGTWL